MECTEDEGELQDGEDAEGEAARLSYIEAYTKSIQVEREIVEEREE